METIVAATSGRAEIPRAQRYGIGTSVRYRVGGGDTWREGMMQNISVSGVLLCTDQPLEVNTAIEMRFVLPLELKGECAAEVFCRGVVVRSSLPEDPANDAKMMAAKIVSSRFLRQTAAKRD